MSQHPVVPRTATPQAPGGLPKPKARRTGPGATRRQSSEVGPSGSKPSEPVVSPAEREFMQAMQDYKQSSGRMFPTWSEVLEVLKTLGYAKAD